MSVLKTICVVLLMILSLQSGFADTDNIYLDQEEQPSIMSLESADHAGVLLRLTSSLDWKIIGNDSRVYCKRLNNKTSLADLKKIIIFDDADLIHIDQFDQAARPDFSEYFKTCNYIMPYRSLFLGFGEGKNTELVWAQTDAYIDTEYSLLLIDFLDEEKTQARALFVYKKYQFHANKQRQRTIWNQLMLVWYAIVN